MTIEDIVKEVNTYLAHNPTLISASINREVSPLDAHTRPITKVKGKWPQGATLMGNLVQGFTTTWNELGVVEIASKKLDNYHQKVNYGLVPADILPSYWAALYSEGLKPEDMPISKWIIENELMPKVTDDVAYLDIMGDYDAGDLGTFGKSMDGVKNVIGDIVAGTPGTDHTAFHIPLNTLTDTNMVDEVTSFERQIPEKMKKKITKIFMSENNVERYVLDYENTFGQNQFQKDQLKSRLGKREIVALSGLDTDLIFATPNDNFVRLIDVFDNKPAITDIQKADYKVKFFLEFWRGIDFLINEMVLVSNYADARLGLGSTALNQKYYGIDGVTVP